MKDEIIACVYFLRNKSDLLWFDTNNSMYLWISESYSQGGAKVRTAEQVRRYEYEPLSDPTTRHIDFNDFATLRIEGCLNSTANPQSKNLEFRGFDSTNMNRRRIQSSSWPTTLWTVMKPSRFGGTNTDRRALAPALKQLQLHIYIYIYTHVHTHAHTYIYIYIYIYICLAALPCCFDLLLSGTLANSYRI